MKKVITVNLHQTIQVCKLVYVDNSSPMHPAKVPNLFQNI